MKKPDKIKVRRNVYNKKTGAIKKAIVNAVLVEERPLSVIVKLDNGDLIKRKKCDIV